MLWLQRRIRGMSAEWMAKDLLRRAEELVKVLESKDAIHRKAMNAAADRERALRLEIESLRAEVKRLKEGETDHAEA